jgi:hypothetical protein
MADATITSSLEDELGAEKKEDPGPNHMIVS